MNATFNSGIVRVFTFKAGLFSTVAHDLQLTLQRFEVTIDGPQVSGRFWPDSLHVDGAIKGGKLNPNTLSERDKRDIYKNMAEKIMYTAKHPEIRFEGRFDQQKLEGQLTMVGRSASISMPITLSDGHICGRIEFAPTRWGIPPFSILMGTIKLQDRVIVEFDLPFDGTVADLLSA